jgi:hypothetical protein
MVDAPALAPAVSGSAADDARRAVQKIVDSCSDGWREADPATGPTDDMKAGQKRAYNAVFHFARALLDELP